MKCRVHPKYKALRKPTSKARGCTCKKVFRDKKTRPSDATLIKKWSEKEREYTHMESVAVSWGDCANAVRYKEVALAFRRCLEDLQGK